MSAYHYLDGAVRRDILLAIAYRPTYPVTTAVYHKEYFRSTSTRGIVLPDECYLHEAPSCNKRFEVTHFMYGVNPVSVLLMSCTVNRIMLATY